MRFTSDLPDKERILLEIISRLASTQCMSIRFDQNWKDSDGNERVHFAIGDKPAPGDVVLCLTSGLHDYTVAVAETSESNGACLLREIGSNRKCNMANEMFYVIRGLKGPTMLEGEQYQMYVKVVKAFGKLDEYVYRYGGVSFRDGNWADITVREVFGWMLADVDIESVPFTVPMEWDKKTSIKKIITALREGGVGTRKFDRRNKKTGELLSRDTLSDPVAAVSG